MVSKSTYYTALAKWDGQCALGEYMLDACDIQDTEIRECRNDKRALTLFVQRHVEKEKEATQEVEVENYKDSN